MSAPKRKATYDDVRRAPETVVAEIVGGELYTSPRPAAPHSRAEVTIAQALRPFDDDPSAPGVPGGWWIFMEPELHFGDDVLVPDLAGWRRTRLPRIPNAAAFTLAPDWVAEIVSPRTAGLDRVRKLPVYAREGVAFLWLVDPVAHTIESFRRDGEHWVLVGVHGDAPTARIPPFDEFELALTRWWLEPSADEPR